MGSEFVVQITNEAVKVALMLAAPMLGGALLSVLLFHFSSRYSNK
jgi:flagellar biosynthesis protein FliQ